MPIVVFRFLLPLCFLLSMSGCGAPADGGEAARNGGANAEPSSLFSDAVHELPMPEPGRARIEFKGQVLEAGMFSDCSAGPELPPDAQAWEPHSFGARPNFQMAEGSASLQFQRLIHPNEENWATAAHEQEIVALTMPNGSDMYTYTLHRLTPNDQAMVARPMDQPARTAGPEDSVPGIRIHPDGHQATFIGLLGQTSMLEELAEPKLEEIRIAIHCGPV